MKKVISNKNAMKSFRQPIGWWLHVGENIYGSVLVVSGIDSSEMLLLSEIAQDIVILDLAVVNELAFIPENIRVSSEISNMSEEFDAIIIDGAAKKISDESIKIMYERLLSPTGFICLYENNKYTAKNLIRSPFRTLVNIFLNLRKKKLKRLNEGMKIWHLPTLSYGRHPDISFRKGNYVSNKNCFLIKEKVKTFIFNSNLFSLFANEHIWLIARSSDAVCLIDRMRDNLYSQGCLWFTSDVQESLVFYKYGKLIMSFRDRNSEGCAYYVVVALCEEATRQRRAEAEIIKKLRDNKKFAKYIQGVVTEYKFGDFPCFVMKNYSGVTVDENNKDLEKMTESAFNVIVELADSTLSLEKNEVHLIERVNDYIQNLAFRLPLYSDRVLKLGGRVSSLLNRLSLRSVCFHGDMKLENFMLDTDLAVSGIIDWELAEEVGFPLLDLYYLIIYNYQIKFDADFADGFKLLCQDGIESNDKKRIEKYADYFDLDILLIETLKLVFFLHHYSTRYFIDPLSAIGVGNFSSCLEAAENKIDLIEE